MRNQKTYLLKTIAILFFVIIVIRLFVIYDLKLNGKLINGLVSGTNVPTKSSRVFEYEFYFKNKKYFRTNTVKVNNYSIFINKKFPVIVSSITKNSRILITPKDFQEFDINFPDSLKWVTEYVK